MKLPRLVSVALGASLVLGLACDGDKGGAGEGDVETAVKIAKAIEAEPDEAEAILEQHDMTADAFEALMFEIAEDPAKSEQFSSKLGGGA